MRPAGCPYQAALELIDSDETVRAALVLANAVRLERRLGKTEHAALLLAGLVAGRRGGAALREWVEKVRAERKPVQASLL